MKNIKRTLAMVLVLCMVFGMLPVGVSAAVTQSTKPADGTMSGEPFNSDPDLSDNSPEHTNYRIPGLVMLNDGTLVAAADIRYDYEYDGGGSDIVVSTSTDKGESWNYSVVAYLGDNGNVHALNSSTMMDPLLITDGEDLYLLYDLFPAGYSLGGGSNTTYAFSATGTGFTSDGKMVLSTSYNSTTGGYYLDGDKIRSTSGTEQSGYTVDAWFNVYQNGTYVSNLFFADSPFYAYPTSYIAMQTSSDGGENWSDPELVNIKHSGTKWQVLGPGSGIVTQNGELAFTVYNSDSSISLVTGSSGDWTTVKTSAAVNESSIVELSDGTIRAFVKNDNNYITYVDFALNEDGTYTAGSAKSTGVANTGWCMISSIMYPRAIDGQDVIMVCCPSTGSSSRYNGKIHVFKLDENNNMTHVKSHEINGASDFFAYSDMEILEDGTIALLYEDGCMYYNGSWAGAGVGYSHIEYITVDPVADMGLTFDEDEDIVVWTFDNNQGEIQLGASAGVTHIHAEPATVDSITSACSAYDIHLCTEGDEDCTDCSSCDKAYTGSATVTLPLPEELKDVTVKGFVLDSDGSVNAVFDVENDGEFVTFEAPHFSVVGIAEVTADDVAYTEERNVTVVAGGSTTDTIEGVAYTEADVKTSPNASVATIDKIESISVAGSKKLVEVTDASSFDGTKKYLIVSERSTTEGMLTSETYTATISWSGLVINGLNTHGTVSEDTTEWWTITVNDDGTYAVQHDGQYLTLNYNTTSTAALVDESSYVNLQRSGNYWYITNSDGDYLSNVGGFVNGYYGASGFNEQGGSGWTIYEVAETAPESSTEVAFAGVSEGTTSAVIGDVKYNITVVADVRDIKLHVGQTMTFTIDGHQYNMDDVTTTPNASIAKLVSVVPADAKLVAVSELVSGEQYLIVNSQTGEVLTDTATTLDGDAGEKSALVTGGTASVNNPELWTITGDATNGYTLVQDGKYLTIAGYYAAMSDTETALKLTYSPSGWMICDDTTWASLENHDNADYYLRNGIADANYGTDALGSSITSSYSYWKIYKIDSTPVTEVTFTGMKAGTTTAKVGHVTYNITVDNVTVGNISDFNNIVGADKYSDDNGNATYRSDLDMTGKKITSLRISEGASFLLGVDVTEYESVTWTTVDPSIATVDADGNVTAVKEGATYVTATVVKNSVEESITIPVTVVPSMVEGYTDSQITSIFYYIEQVDDTDPYYTMFLNTESTTGPVAGHRLVKVSEGEVIWYERPTNSAFAWVWTADPWEGYALTKMGSSGSIDEYYPLRDVNDITQLGDGKVDTDGDGTADTEYYYTSASFNSGGAPNNAYKNVVVVGNDGSASWRTALNDLLKESILIGQGIWPNYGCDGAMSNTRWDHDGVPKLVTAMTFISDPMPRIEKSVNGILPTTGLRKDFRPYTDGMLATVGEYVYFEVSITVDRPSVWRDEANGIGAISYTDAIVTDTVLDGAYFYVQAKDTNNNGLIDEGEGEQLQIEDITDRLNAAWGAEEKTRTIDLYLVYVITNEDMDDNKIDNTAGLTWKYKSHYSTGSLSGSADAAASIYVVGQALDDVVIDFGQSIAYEGLTDAHLDSDSVIEANYGDVSIQKVYVDSADESKGYTYTLTYTPTEILQAPDAVMIYGKNADGSKKLINGFVVYPATTVYYEEGFMLDGNSGWVTTNAKDATVNQEFELLNKTTYVDGVLTYVSDKQHAYGYDPIYANGSVEESNITTNVMGAKTSFTFTGTGFELFANSTPDTGWIIVEVTRANGTNAKLYMVDTAATAGITGATSDQAQKLDSLPIVSVKDLEHGTYTVSLRKLMDDGKTVIVDGVRITNTVADSSVFDIDLEDNPEFYQLRDMVLNSFGVALEGVSVDYKDMCDQVYNAANGAAAIITSESVDYANSSNLQDLLDNGPKNELYLRAGQTLTFSVKTSRALQIGLKAPAGATSYTLTYKVGDDTTAVATNAALTSTEDLFYALGNEIGTEQEYTITVKNTGSNVLSVTDLKICDDPSAAFVPLEEADVRNILLAAGYVDPDATEEPEEPVVPAADAVLNIVLVDYTGKRLSTAQLITSGPANSTAIFTAEEIMAAAKMPKGCDFADTVSDATVICGTSGTITIRAGKVATLKVTYVNAFGKTVGTATFTKVQTAPGFFSVTAEQIKNAAPEGRIVLWLTGAMAAYGRETNLIVPVL